MFREKYAAATALFALLCGLLLAGCGDQDPQRRLASAKEYLQKKDTKAAVIELKNALQANSDLGEARYLLGTAMLLEGNVVAAEVEFRKALATGFQAELVVPQLARSMLLLGQSKKLIDEFGIGVWASPLPMPVCTQRLPPHLLHWTGRTALFLS